MKQIPMDDVANILNTINDALERIGYVATGYSNMGGFLEIMIERGNPFERQTSGESCSETD